MRAEVCWLETPKTRLAVLPRPRGGEYLFDEIASLRAQGIEVLVSLLTESECTELNLEHEPEACNCHSVQFIRFPIEDRDVPKDQTSTREIVATLQRFLADGRGVGVHCRAGIGRSAMSAAAVLCEMGLSPEKAFERIGAARGCDVPDTSEQRAWLEEFARLP